MNYRQESHVQQVIVSAFFVPITHHSSNASHQPRHTSQGLTSYSAHQAPLGTFYKRALLGSFETQRVQYLDSVSENLILASRSLCDKILGFYFSDPPMPARKPIWAPDNARSKRRKRPKSICPGRPSHQQQPSEVVFHDHNLRSRRQSSSDPQEDPKVKYKMAGTSLKHRRVIWKDTNKKYKEAKISGKNQTIEQGNPGKEYEKADTSVEGQTIVRKSLERSTNKQVCHSKSRYLSENVLKRSVIKQIFCAKIAKFCQRAWKESAKSHILLSLIPCRPLFQARLFHWRRKLFGYLTAIQERILKV